MDNFNFKKPTTCNALIAFGDLTNFVKFSRKLESIKAFNLIDEFYEITGEIVKKNNGRVVKFVGDASIVIFSEDNVSKGINALKQYKSTVDNFLKESNLNSQLIVKAHFGEIVCGPMGVKGNKEFDILGENVNIAATIKSNGFSITPQVFRKLDQDARKLFKKHTPPITYIDIMENHKD